HPADQDTLKRRVLDAVRTRDRVLRLEYRLLHRDGSVRWVADRRQMIYGEDGKLRWVDGLILDITDRKRSDVALRLTQFTVDRGSEATYWMDPDGRLIYVNDRACEALGYTREELLSMKIQEINPEFPPERWRHHWDELRERRTFSAESTHRAKDGHLIPVEIRANYIEFDGREYNCVYARDITARKRDEALILLERDFSKAVLDSLPGIFYLFDRMGKFLRWNTNFEEITGYSAEEIGRMHPLDLFAGTDKALVQERITEVFVKGASEGEAELVTKSGMRMTYYFTGHAFHGKEEPCLIGTGIDISERKKLEEQLRKSQKMEAMVLLAGGIAHDFNNLLTGILGYANLLSINERVNPEVARAAGIIQRSAEKASQLTAQLLGFAEQGKNLNVPVELGRVIASVTGVLERTQDPCIRIVASLRPEGGCVRGDPSQLDQVVMNLAINACDAMPRGGQLKFTTEPMTIDEAFCRERDWMSPGKYLLLSVADTGVGISPENLERIFDPFFTTKAKGKGTGLGLSMVFGIVKNHGGCIDVRSEAGAGTVVRVYLPESSEVAPEEAA
ncbi:MAG TPA: PAS domain S-box protein, partial [Desulfobacteria bacterium]|nr:PAS domain S-box protein [Desulfobacteria bacterium]